MGGHTRNRRYGRHNIIDLKFGDKDEESEANNSELSC